MAERNCEICGHSLPVKDAGCGDEECEWEMAVLWWWSFFEDVDELTAKGFSYGQAIHIAGVRRGQNPIPKPKSKASKPPKRGHCLVCGKMVPDEGINCGEESCLWEMTLVFWHSFFKDVDELVAKGLRYDEALDAVSEKRDHRPLRHPWRTTQG